MSEPKNFNLTEKEIIQITLNGLEWYSVLTALQELPAKFSNPITEKIKVQLLEYYDKNE